MSTYNGRNADVKKGTYVVAELASWSLDLSNDEIDTTAFGSTWKKSDVGMRGWSVSVEGHYDPSDTNGQGAIETAWANGSLINDIKLYIDNTSYWIPDVTTDSNAGGRVTSYAVGQAHDGVASISFTLAGSGPITFV
jgi:predicted secreted protein